MTGAAAAAVSVSPPVLGVSVPVVKNGHAPFAPITTAAATATVTGGTGPYAYAWSAVIGGGSGVWTINSPSSQTTTFTCTDTGLGDFASQDFICTVTDSASAVAESNTLTANATATG
jgi:hypothetical protein